MRATRIHSASRPALTASDIYAWQLDSVREAWHYSRVADYYGRVAARKASRGQRAVWVLIATALVGQVLSILAEVDEISQVVGCFAGGLAGALVGYALGQLARRWTIRRAARVARCEGCQRDDCEPCRNREW